MPIPGLTLFSGMLFYPYVAMWVVLARDIVTR